MANYIFHVAKNGSDLNTGSAEMPFATPQKATEAVRKLISAGLTKPVTILIHAGTYNVNNLLLTAEDSGTKDCPVTYKAFGDGDVIFTNGKTIPIDFFKPLTDKSILDRLYPEAREHIVVADLKAAGFERAELGEMHVIGAYCTAGSYDDYVPGIISEMFWGKERMFYARYPNYKDGYTSIEGVKDQGEKAPRNAKGGTISVTDDLKERMKKWTFSPDMFAYGKFFWEWADSSTPISAFDADEGTLTFKHRSGDGYREGNPYFVYNVIEELDAPGEYYIDRDKMLLYAYKPDSITTEDAMITISMDPVVSGENVSFVTFDGIDFTGSKQCTLSLNGRDCTVTNCKIYNTVGCKPSAVFLDGYNMKMTDSEVFNIGRFGVSLHGGDHITLTPSGNVIENCYVHGFGQVQRTSIFGIRMQGVGNTMRHCELCDAPHSAICYYRNYNVVEYNYVHDVCTEVSDGGALYVGGTYANLGCEIRYNYFENIGTKKYFGNAIYFDDGMSGQIAYGNVIKNTNGCAFLCGGGSHHHIYNNLMLNCGTTIFYDDRFADNGWAAVIKFPDITKSIVYTVKQFPYESEVFTSRFPWLKELTLDIKDHLEPNFPANPAYSVIENNISDEKCQNVAVSDLVDKMSSIQRPFMTTEGVIDEKTMHVDEAFIKENNVPWEQIPFDKIGRIKK